MIISYIPSTSRRLEFRHHRSLASCSLGAIIHIPQRHLDRRPEQSSVAIVTPPTLLLKLKRCLCGPIQMKGGSSLNGC